MGVDLFADWSEGDRDPNVIGKRLEALCPDSVKLKMITNRGVKVYPDGLPETFCTDHWRCRFVSSDFKSNDNMPAITPQDIIDLMSNCAKEGMDVIKTENLY